MLELICCEYLTPGGAKDPPPLDDSFAMVREVTSILACFGKLGAAILLWLFGLTFL